MKNVFIGSVIGVVAGVFVACGGTGNATGPGGTKPSSLPSCQYSTAKTGSDSCQVNFFCDQGELAIYCLGTADGGSNCTCHESGQRTPSTRSDFCKLESEARVEAARTACGWNI